MKSNITRPLAFALALLANFLPIASAENKTLDNTLVGEQASEETMLKVFGHSTFSEFLASVNSPDGAGHLTKRATSPVCQTSAGSPFLNDAQNDANGIAGLPPSWACTNNNINGCTIMWNSANVKAGICSPYQFSIACNVLPAYLYGLINSCRSDIYGPPTKIAGFQGLNENRDVYVFINN